jgi:predicted nucleic acid-binding Zn ribbon protein
MQLTLERLLRRIDPDERLRAFRVWTFWSDEVGKTIAGHAQPVALRAGLLTVSVDSPTWMQELQFLKETLRERLNGRLGEALIDDIYFVSGAAAPTPRRATTEPSIGPPPAPLPRLRDPELAAAFARIVQARARRAQDQS